MGFLSSTGSLFGDLFGAPVDPVLPKSSRSKKT
jgi:hypothetical protein